MVAGTYNHNTQGAEAKLQESEATLGYIAKWKPAWTSLKEKEESGWGPPPWRGTSSSLRGERVVSKEQGQPLPLSGSLSCLLIPPSLPRRGSHQNSAIADAVPSSLKSYALNKAVCPFLPFFFPPHSPFPTSCLFLVSWIVCAKRSLASYPRLASDSRSSLLSLPDARSQAFAALLTTAAACFLCVLSSLEHFLC